MELQKYCLSIKFLKTGLTDEEYRLKYKTLLCDLLTLHQEIFFDYFYEEHDQHGILHLHGVMRCPKKWGRWQLLHEGFNVNHKPLKNAFGWLMYASNYQKNRSYAGHHPDVRVEL